MCFVALYRNPTPTHANHDNKDLVEWKPTTRYPVNYLRIGNKDVKHRPLIQMETGLLQERADFWMKIGSHLPSRKPRDEL